MSIEIVVLAVCGVLILLVLARISLTLNEMSASLRKLARRKPESGKTATSAILHEKEPAGETDAGSEAEVVAAIAAAQVQLEKSGSAEGVQQ